MEFRLIDSLGSTAEVARVFADPAMLAAMLEFEAALAAAEAGLGIIPTASAEVIARASTPARPRSRRPS